MSIRFFIFSTNSYAKNPGLPPDFFVPLCTVQHSGCDFSCILPAPARKGGRSPGETGASSSRGQGAFHRRGGKQKPKPPSDAGFHLRGGKQKPKPPSDEGGGPKGRRERFRCIIIFALRENGTGLSPPVNFVDSPLVRGGQGVSFQKTASLEGAEGGCLKPASSEGAEGGLR